MSTQLENFLLKTGLLAATDLETCREQAERSQTSLWDVVIKSQRVSEDVLAGTFARWFRLPRVGIASATVEPEAVQIIDERLARKHVCLPLRVEGKTILVAFANPLDYDAIRDVQFAAGLEVRALVATRTEILDAIGVHYAVDDHLADFLAQVPDVGDLRIVEDTREEVDADQASQKSATEVEPVVKLCNLVINDGLKMRASDIHIEPGLNDVQVRFRIDGVLRDYTQVPKWLHNPVVSRLKILARLDIAERRLPQDGRIDVVYQHRAIDIRVSTLPTHFGEKVVLRLLKTTAIPTLEQLGLSAVQVSILDAVIAQPQGMVLVTGPTGSGKSTTLYSMIEKRKSPEVNIVTVEDPIEYQLPGISQVQVNTRAGLTFASVSRSVLRQDPDVILVGEMRDAETCEIAFQAAATGHLVFSTLHTNSSLATIARLLQMGIEPFQIAESLSLIIAQRLARRVCEKCREKYEPAPGSLERLRIDRESVLFVRGKGCPACGNTGYSGRVGIYEIVRMTPALRDVIHRRGPEAELRVAALRDGASFLLDEAQRKVITGQTTAEEVLRVIKFDDEATTTCPSCRAIIERSFSTCPYCLHTFRRLCPQCGQEVKPDWKACPYCNSRLHLGHAPAASTRTPIAETSPPVSIVAAMTPRAGAPPGLVVALSPSSAADARGLPAPGQDTGVERPIAMPPPAAGGTAERKILSILIVDDDAEMRTTIVEALDQLPVGTRITAVRDGQEALESVEQARPDLVVLDLKMPRVDGFTVCQKLRESVRTAFVPIVMLTASADEESRTTGFLLGTDDYITKPFSVGELKARVARILRRAYGI